MRIYIVILFVNDCWRSQLQRHQPSEALVRSATNPQLVKNVVNKTLKDLAISRVYYSRMDTVVYPTTPLFQSPCALTRRCMKPCLCSLHSHISATVDCILTGDSDL